MNSRLGQRFRDGEVAVENVQEVLDGGGDDARASGGADGDVEGVEEGMVGRCEVFDYDVGDTAERTFSRADEISRAGDVAEGVGGVGDAEVLWNFVRLDRFLREMGYSHSSRCS